jgi:hypothetical protein
LCGYKCNVHGNPDERRRGTDVSVANQRHKRSG